MPADVAAAALVVLGLVSGAVVAALGRHAREGLRVLLDFLVAAGLIRLLGPQSWSALAVAAATIAVRQLAGRGLSVRTPSLQTRPGPAGRAVGP